MIVIRCPQTKFAVRIILSCLKITHYDLCLTLTAHDKKPHNKHSFLLVNNSLSLLVKAIQNI